MIKNKKAWLRIVEATIAVLIIASVLFVMIFRLPEGDSGENIREMQRFALERVSKDDTLRERVISYDTSPVPAAPALNEAIIIDVNNSINEIIPAYWGHDLRICEVEEICGIENYPDKEVYADEILISSTLTEFSPKKLKLFVWRK